MKKIECHNYWSNPDGRNDPANYLDNADTDQRTGFLVRKIKKNYKGKSNAILEIGCNVGRNLNGLFDSGYNNLSGIDANENALKLLQENYGDMNEILTARHGFFEDLIPNIPDETFDIVYSMAALMHIHPDSEFIFNEIKRITKRAIITIELEMPAKNPRVFIRDYKKVFEGNGWVQKETELVGKSGDAALANYTYRLFKKI